MGRIIIHFNLVQTLASNPHQYYFDIVHLLQGYDFEEQEVKINDNSPDEILLACKDLLYLIDKEFVLTSEKLDMSNKFWKKYLKAKSLHKIDYDYYKQKPIKSYYSWSNIALKKIL